MAHEVADCYDQLAANFHLLFEDWEASIARQAAAIGPILEGECGASRPLRILDCACGIGTQSLGLAKRGHRITGCDLSGGAVARAAVETRQRGLDIEFLPADMLELDALPLADFDAVICLDNALPHLDTRDRLRQAAAQIRSKLRRGGIFLASVRDYDRLVRERPVVHGPGFLGEEGERRIVHQIWDWMDERRYTFHLYITRQAGGAWESIHVAALYYCWLRGELSAVLVEAGFAGIRWLEPAESGFFQPLVLARSA